VKKEFAFSLVFKSRFSLGIADDVEAMGEYQDPDGCYMASILY
jgi:hypothetical protein